MNRISVSVASFAIFLLFSTSNSETEEVKKALIEFMTKLSPEEAKTRPNFGWNSTSDPCTNKWQGIQCDSQGKSVKKIVLERLNLTGILDTASLCKATTITVFSLIENNIGGEMTEDISNCRWLTHMYLSNNRFSGTLPTNLSRLNNLKRLDISNNEFSGPIPNLSRISGLLSFLAQNNKLDGTIPEFDFSNLSEFNVSNNNLTGPVPNVNGLFNESSFSGNPGLCGKPLPNTCVIIPPSEKKKSKGSEKTHFLIYLGYAILGLLVVSLVLLKLCKRKKGKKNKVAEVEAEKSSSSTSSSIATSAEYKSGTGLTRSEYSITSSTGSGNNANSLVVLSSPVVNGLKFEDLLKAPAELIGRGKHGSLYKVVLHDGVNVAVKRIKDWGISRAEFKKRMQRLDRVKHPNVVPALAYYCSKQEKLLVYEFQKNGSLFKLLQGSQNGQSFDWESRLSIAARTSEALAFMHKELSNDKIAHGNLKCSNILLNDDMEPCISEYGLMVFENNPNRRSNVHSTDSIKSVGTASGPAYSTFKVDVYALGVILLELLTGKLVNNTGFDLAGYVHSAVREEWTVEVFDKALVSEGANEERMVNLLQVALKCINPTPEARPSMDQVAAMVNSIKEDDERSISSDL